MGIIFSVFAVAISIGPVIGGLMTQRVTWRWIFYMNLPISGAALILLALVLKVQYKKDTARNSLKRVDFSGNALLIASVVAVLLALTWGGTENPWSSWRILVPLILGSLGLAAFLAIESTSLIPEPTMPLRLFSNRTSLSSFGLTFVHAILTYWISYFLPLYFQSALEASPTRSGVMLLPTAIAAMPFAILAGRAISKFGHYRVWHFLGFIILMIAYGVFSMLDQHSSSSFWIAVQFLGAAGCGVLLTTTLPAIQAPLGEEDVAVATATWSFVRSFGGIWGVAIPAAVFNSHANSLLHRVDDEDLRNLLANGGAYAMASKEFLQSLNSTPEIKEQVLSIYVDGLQLVWQVGIALAVSAY